MSVITLRRHGLRHIPDLTVDPELLSARFDRTCGTTACSGRCCADGVWADVTERDAILRHVDAVHRHMDTTQEHDPTRWFDGETREDPDFPSGRAFGTAVSNGSCVFLRSDRLCALQAASDAQTGRLKPLFCFAFPVTIENGLLCLDDPRDAACCTPSATGTMTALEFCADELIVLLGADGVEELRTLDRKDP